MSQVSKHKLNQKVFNKIFLLFPKLLGRLSRKGDEKVVIGVLFSTTERTMIAKRVATAFMLTKGYTYAQIKSKLHVSNGTIGKIAEITKSADSKFVNELHLIAKEQEFSDFLNAIDYKLSVILPPKGGNWSTWRRKIEEDRRKKEQPF